MGVLLRLQENAFLRQSRRQTTLRLPSLDQVKTRLEFLAQHHGVGLITGEVGAGKSTAARVFTATLNTSLYKILYVHFSSGSALDLLRQIALELDLTPAQRALRPTGATGRRSKPEPTRVRPATQCGLEGVCGHWKSGEAV